MIKKDQNLQCHKMLSESPWVSRGMRRLLYGIAIITLIIMLLPWTQNIRSVGTVTTLLPGERPQEIQSLISGRIENWYVKEGDFVKKGDTIIRISEIKENYLDPALLTQTDKQLRAKENAVLSYSAKVNAINRQIEQLNINREMKLKQTVNKLQQEELKLKSVSAEWEAARINYNIALSQYRRDSVLQIQGLKSPLDVENRKVKLQEAQAKRISYQNLYESAQAAVENARFEINNIRSEYAEKLAKTEGDRFSTISSQLEAEAEVAKLRNAYSNYTIRNGFYTITAPQDGYISQARASGIGETVKEGTAICTIMPSISNSAVELFIDPVDMPLVSKGNHIRFVFDGWPTIYFRGWPKFSTGTFPGEVFAIDNLPSANGKYRVLVIPEPGGKPWPGQLRVGTGARGYMLLKQVSVWYEIWRQLNGFPPDYYVEKTGKKPSFSNEK